MTTARDRPPEEAAEDTSFARGLRLLLAVADRGEVRADELGSALEMPVSTVYRYLRTLVDFGFVDRTGGTFRLGPKLLIGTGANVSTERYSFLNKCEQCKQAPDSYTCPHCRFLIPLNPRNDTNHPSLIIVASTPPPLPGPSENGA